MAASLPTKNGPPKKLITVFDQDGKLITGPRDHEARA